MLFRSPGCPAIRASADDAALDRTDLDCQRASSREVRAFPLETTGSLLGFFVLRVEDPDGFGLYEPFLAGFANSLALWLENRRSEERRVGEEGRSRGSPDH